MWTYYVLSYFVYFVNLVLSFLFLAFYYYLCVDNGLSSTKKLIHCFS
jgi:hypothetical protein